MSPSKVRPSIIQLRKLLREASLYDSPEWKRLQTANDAYDRYTKHLLDTDKEAKARKAEVDKAATDWQAFQDEAQKHRQEVLQKLALEGPTPEVVDAIKDFIKEVQK